MTQQNIPFTEQLQQFATDNDHSFRSFSPTAKVPCLLDGEVVAWESLAIVEYLAERYPGCLRDDSPTKIQGRMNSPLQQHHFTLMLLRRKLSEPQGDAG